MTPFIGDKALLVMNHFDQVMKMRTGVSPDSMSLDADTLQNQTATAANNMKDAAYSQIEIIARNMAEYGGWKDVFAKSLRIIVKNQDRPRTIRLRDEWVEMDPRYWNANMDAQINVGLGTGSRERDMVMLNQILSSQIMIVDRFTAGGFSQQAMEMLPKVVKTMIKVGEAAGIKSPETYYPKVGDEEMAAMMQQMQEMASQPSPEEKQAQAKIEAETQIKQAEMQMDAQKSQAEMAYKQQECQQKAQLDQQKFAAEMALKREQLTAEMGLKREQLQAELLLKQQQFQQEMALNREMATVNAFNSTRESSAKVSSTVHVGGEPG
jgi:hypothetical protein